MLNPIISLPTIYVCLLRVNESRASGVGGGWRASSPHPPHSPPPEVCEGLSSQTPLIYSCSENARMKPLWRFENGASVEVSRRIYDLSLNISISQLHPTPTIIKVINWKRKPTKHTHTLTSLSYATIVRIYWCHSEDICNGPPSGTYAHMHQLWQHPKHIRSIRIYRLAKCEYIQIEIKGFYFYLSRGGKIWSLFRKLAESSQATNHWDRNWAHAYRAGTM